MSKPTLRIYRESADSTPVGQEPVVRMTLRDVFPLLVHAHRLDKQWLKDLAGDQIVVTQDLADIVRALNAMSSDKRSA